VLLICFRFEIFTEFNFTVTVGTSFVFELSSAKEGIARNCLEGGVKGVVRERRLLRENTRRRIVKVLVVAVILRFQLRNEALPVSEVSQQIH
jgi:hypothetical protein